MAVSGPRARHHPTQTGHFRHIVASGETPSHPDWSLQIYSPAYSPLYTIFRSSRFGFRPHIHKMMKSLGNLSSYFTTSSFQESAISDLRGVDETTVLTWLSVLRSLEPGFKHAPRAGGLTSQQFNAVSTLLSFSDQTILELLRANNASGWRYQSMAESGLTC